MSLRTDETSVPVLLYPHKLGLNIQKSKEQKNPNEFCDWWVDPV